MRKTTMRFLLKWTKYLPQVQTQKMMLFPRTEVDLKDVKVYYLKVYLKNDR